MPRESRKASMWVRSHGQGLTQEGRGPSNLSSMWPRQKGETKNSKQMAEAKRKCLGVYLREKGIYPWE